VSDGERALDSALAVAQQAADEAGALALAGLGRAREVAHKGSSSDLVTEHDLAVERAIVGRLRAAFADDAIVGEEGTADRAGAGRAWYVDPIDGTTNFAHGLPFFCVSIGLRDSAGPAVGVIDVPALGWRFWARRGGGAFARLRGEPAGPLAVSRTQRLDEALLATGFPYDLRTSPEDNLVEFAHLQRAAQAVRRVGAAALDLAMVAAGWYDGYWEQKLKPWDLLAGIVLVTEAGGRVSGYDGEAVDLEVGRLVASNGRIHAELVGALKAAKPSQPL
jgi:myo-inositol-1(or 4)-monophosphatase